MSALPDPNVIAGAFETLCDQSQRIANVPAVQNQHDVLAAIQDLGQRINGLQQQMDQRFDQVNHRLDQINNRFGTLQNRQHNLEIAAVNARLFMANTAAVLQDPVDIRNGGNIPNFPQTQPQLYAIDDVTADAILPALGIHLAPNTPLAIKRESIARKWILK
ncbi:hypothetical protein OQA88_10287 [Cercophora sp. LCS_1]